MMKHSLFSRGLALLLCAVLLLGYLPAASADEVSTDVSTETVIPEPELPESSTAPETTPEVFENVVDYTVSEHGEVTITEYFGRAKEVVIPETINGMPLTTIGQECFYGNLFIESVVIPDSVVSIEKWAFCTANNLKQVTFGAGLKRIGFHAFAGCNLQELVLPEGLEYIDDGAFNGNFYMTSLSIPSTVTHIGQEAFASCWYLEEMSMIPASVTHIGTGAFLNCYELPAIWVDENNPNYSSDSQGVLYDKNQTYLYRIPGGYQGDYVMPDTVTRMAVQAGYRVGSTGALTISDNLTVIPEKAFKSSAFSQLDLGTGVTTIGKGAFNLCGQWTELEIPANVTAIGDSAFAGSGDMQELTIPETVLSFGKAMFAGCDELCYVYLPEGMTYIPESAFSECEHLISVEMPDSLHTIGESAFYRCERLKEVFIPENVDTIEDLAFKYCFNLETIVFTGDAPDMEAHCLESVTATVYYPAGKDGWTEDKLLSYGEYSHINWVEYADGETPWNPDSLLPEGLTWSVNDDEVTITGYTGTETELVIPPMIEDYEVRYIASYAFLENDTLESVILPSTLKEIKDSAFSCCVNLKSVTIPEGLTSIGNYAFASCLSLESIVLPQSVMEIRQSAFSNCRSLTSFRFPDNVRAVARNVLADCKNLESVTLPLYGAYIESEAFANCSKLKVVVIPPEINTVSSSAFTGCSALEEIGVFDSNPYYNSEDGVLLNGNSSAIVIYPMGKAGPYTMPDTVIAVGTSAFANSLVTELTLSENLEHIDEYAFAYCETLTSVMIPQNLIGISSMAFYENPALEAIWVHPDNPYYCSDSQGVLYNKDQTELLKYPLGRAGACTVPEGVTFIGEYAFFNSQEITYLTLPDSLEEVGTNAFDDCPNLVIRCSIGSYGEYYAQRGHIPYEYTDTVTGLSVASMPAKLTYAVGGTLRLSGLTLYATLENGRRVTVETGFSVDPVDMSTPGTKQVTVWWSGASVTFEITVDASLVEYPESNHPYGENENQTWSYTHRTAAEELRITFSQDTRTEDYYDIIYIIDGNGELVGEYSGNALAGQTVTVPGNSFYIQLVSDESVCYHGFTITNILAVGASVEETTQPEPSNPPIEILEHLNYSIIGEKVTITGYTGSANELTIPAYIEGYPVRYIATDAFWGNDTLTGIVLPDTLTEIGDSAFCMCENLIYAEIPSGVSIGSWAFAWCNALEEITLPEELTSIGESAFYDCSNLTQIVIPDGVTAIPEGLFEDCYSLVSVTLPQSAETIGAAAFCGCSSLETLTIPANVLSISMESQDRVFERCSSLKAIYVHDANSNYSSDASGVLFNKEKTQLLLCPAAKTGTYTLPQTVTAIREKAFEGSGLSQIILPEAVQDIGAYAFAYSDITTITIPQNVETLGWDRFEGCANLASIWVHEDNEKYSCDEYGVLFDKDKRMLIRMPSAYEGPYTAPEGLLYVGEKAFAQCNGPTEVVLPEGLEGIGGYAFYGSPSLTYVTLPASITDIGDAYENLFVFAESPNLIARCVLSSYSANWVAAEGVPYEYVDGIEEIMITALPNKLTYQVGEQLQLEGMVLNALAYNGNVVITVINGFTTNPVDMNTPGEKTVEVWWSNCSASFAIAVGDVEEPTTTEPEVTEPEVTEPEVTEPVESEPAEEIPEGLQYAINNETVTITGYAGSATELVIPDIIEGYPVTAIGGHALQGRMLTSVVLPDSVAEIGESAFQGCYMLTNVNMPENLKVIGNWAFENCVRLISVDIPEGTAIIGANAFGNCSALTAVSMPNSITEVGRDAFFMCENLQYNMYSNVKYLGNAENPYVLLMRADNQNLTLYPIHEDTRVIGSFALQGCSQMLNIVIPENVVSIGDYAISHCERLVSVTIGSNVKSIGVHAFAFSESLQSVQIPASVTHIGDGAFENCYRMTAIMVDGQNEHYSNDDSGVLFNKDKTVLLQAPGNLVGSYEIPAGVIKVNDWAFSYCNVTAVTVPDGVRELGAGAFRGCTELQFIAIGKDVEMIGVDFAMGCTSLTAITADDNNPYFYADDRGVLFDKEQTVLIQAPGAIHGAYSIPGTVSEIMTHAFSQCHSLTAIAIPNSVRSIGDGAFEYCNSLTEVLIPDGVTRIGSTAFFGCSMLTDVYIPDSVNEIADNAFYECADVSIHCASGSYGESYAVANGIPVVYMDDLIGLSVETLPDKLVYPVGGLVELDGLSLRATLESGAVKIITVGYAVGEVDMSTPGTKTVTVYYGGLSASFDITVDASIVVYPESDHPYGDNVNKTWSYVHNGPADELHITFSEFTRTEENYDWIYIYDGEGNQIGDEYCGTALAGQTVTVLGNSFSIRLTSDGSVSEFFGFAVTNIEAVVYCTHDNCRWTVIQQPTFTTEGVQQAVCPDCLKTVTQQIPCLEGQVDRWNISLQDDLQVNFHLAISESIASSARVKILVGNDAVTYRVSALEKTEDGLYIVSANIAAAQMTDYIIVMVVSGGNVSTSTYTVRQYADTVLANDDLSDYHAMVKEMLNYGAAAQAYFDYDADLPANEGITDVGTAEIPETVGPTQGMLIWDAAEGASFYGASLLYREKITLRLYFKCAEDGYTFAVNNEPCQVTRRDGYYIVDVAGITPENLDRQVEVDVTGSNDEYLGVVYSPMNYMVRMNQKGSAELKNLLKALYNYHLAAKALRAA